MGVFLLDVGISRVWDFGKNSVPGSNVIFGLGAFVDAFNIFLKRFRSFIDETDHAFNKMLS